jgi:hypothetical protein
MTCEEPSWWVRLKNIFSNETKEIRELLIAKAFSPIDTEETPP